jgi:hypothetical protein
VRSAVIGNTGTLVVFRVGSRDAELLAPEFRPMESGTLADQEPYTAWLRCGIGRDRIFASQSHQTVTATRRTTRGRLKSRFINYLPRQTYSQIDGTVEEATRRRKTNGALDNHS